MGQFEIQKKEMLGNQYILKPSKRGGQGGKASISPVSSVLGSHMVESSSQKKMLPIKCRNNGRVRV